MAEAKGAIQRNDLEAKGIALGKAISIIGGLSDSLNMDIDSEISEQLASLYEYIVECLMMANLNGSEAKLNESMRLLKTIKSAWDEIASEVA